MTTTTNKTLPSGVNFSEVSKDNRGRIFSRADRQEIGVICTKRTEITIAKLQHSETELQH